MLSEYIYDFFLLIKYLTPSYILETIIELPMYYLYQVLQFLGL
jgi:hypothetical protein